MLCCALIATLIGQPALLIAAIRARLFSTGFDDLAVRGTSRRDALFVGAAAQLLVLATGGGALHLYAAGRFALAHPSLCSLFPGT